MPKTLTPSTLLQISPEVLGQALSSALSEGSSWVTIDLYEIECRQFEHETRV